MKLDRTSLRSKVARRMFTLFVACALIPIAILAIISFTQVTDHLSEQSRRRLRQASKAAALTIYERLMFLESELKIIASVVADSEGRPAQKISERLGEDLRKRFRAIELISLTGRRQTLLGQTADPPKMTSEERLHLEAGKTLVSSLAHSELPARILMSMALDPDRRDQRILLGEIDPDYLWGVSERDSLPPMTELCVLDASNHLLVCSVPVPRSLAEQVKVRLTQSTSGQFEWEHDGDAYLASYWSLPLKFRYFLPNWTVVLSESKTHILAPLTQFKKKFPLVVLMALGVVLLLSTSQIRRRLEPLEKLKDGTHRIARREFESPVTVKSGDEFEELATSFNTMARQLSKQFNALATIAEIDRAILSALDTEKILGTVLSRAHDVLPCDHVSAVLFDAEGRPSARLYLRDGDSESRVQAEPIFLRADEIEARCGSREGAIIVDRDPAHPLAPLFKPGVQSLLVIPVFLSHRLSGIIALGYFAAPSLSEEDLLQARQLADQVAVAIHNSELYHKTRKQAEELERANRVKDEFLSVMSHELRTPLAVIMGFTGMVRERLLGEINPEQDKALASVIQRSTDLLGLINSIMEATMIETGAARTEGQEFRLKDFLDHLRSLYDVPLSKGLTLRWDYPAHLPSVRLDSTKLKHRPHPPRVPASPIPRRGETGKRRNGETENGGIGEWGGHRFSGSPDLRFRGRGLGGVQGGGYGHRYSQGGHTHHLREIPPGGQLRKTGVQRGRIGALYRQEIHLPSRRQSGGRKRARRRFHLHPHSPLRTVAPNSLTGSGVSITACLSRAA
ncbi:MAG: HAMP domain-containing protein [Deltaproteobacteria bacterium]|nr:HAMP domain-containing protein [Deltaproteobacteria bacterium]